MPPGAVCWRLTAALPYNRSGRSASAGPGERCLCATCRCRGMRRPISPRRAVQLHGHSNSFRLQATCQTILGNRRQAAAWSGQVCCRRGRRNRQVRWQHEEFHLLPASYLSALSTRSGTVFPAGCGATYPSKCYPGRIPRSRCRSDVVGDDYPRAATMVMVHRHASPAIPRSIIDWLKEQH